MNNRELEARISGIVEPVIRTMGMDLEGIHVGRSGRRYLIRIYIEKEGGVTLDDCERVSRDVGAVLDVEDPVPHAYTLEVSSPGLDRPLRTPADFKRFSGRTVRVVTTRPIEKQTFFVGDLVEVSDSHIVLSLPGDKKVTVSFADISRARLEVKF